MKGFARHASAVSENHRNMLRSRHLPTLVYHSEFDRGKITEDSAEKEHPLRRQPVLVRVRVTDAAVVIVHQTLFSGLDAHNGT